jgi:cation diffusion facilitator family transporter
MLAVFLSDGPKMLAELESLYVSFPRRFGFFIELVDQESLDRGDLKQVLLDGLTKMKEAGWVDCQGEYYNLTPLGIEKSKEKLACLRTAGLLGNKLVQPQTVSKITFWIHIGLAAIKLPAGLLSGSMGLINDGADTLLDGLASLLVYAGLRFNRERQVNILLVLMMLGTGGLTLYEAVLRLFIPFEPDVDWFAFLAAALSALVCLALWGYQRYVGLRSGSVSLITQSVDSRNHVIVGIGVTAGLTASLLQFSLLDTIVGLAVAVLILKSAVELGIETIRSLKEGEVDLSRYRMGLLDQYAQFRQVQLRDWMLYLVEKEQVQTQAALRVRACQAFDFTGNPALRGLGLDQMHDVNQLIDQSLHELFERGWLTRNEHLFVTDVGRMHLSQLMKRAHAARHRLSSS